MRKLKSKLTVEDSNSSKCDKIKKYPTFKSMKLKAELLKGILNHGFVDPSPIQQKAIMPIIEGDDVIIQAQSGSGKTATFCIGILQTLDFTQKVTEKPITQALVLAPTRELAQQICKVFDSLSDFMNAKGTACYGGTSGKEVGLLTKKLREGQHVVVGTPGRVIDMIKHGHLSTDQLTLLIVDEADEMMAQGLNRQLETIYRRIAAPALQVIIVSATLPKACLELAAKFQTDPTTILVRADRLSVKTLTQFYIDVGSEENKFSALSDIYANNTVHQTIIFANTRQKVDWLAGKMRADGFTVSSVHGQVEQHDRERLMEQFRSLETRVLICTDIWARGIDVHTVNLVVNYDLPVDRNNRKFINKEVYLHRVGRSGRYERRGVAVSLVTRKERDALKELAKHFSITIKPAPKDLEILTADLNQ